MEDLVRYTIESASAKGVDYAEARLHIDSGSAFTLTNGIPEPVQLARERGIACQSRKRNRQIGRPKLGNHYRT
jgi:predicted Zn-dependent protease